MNTEPGEPDGPATRAFLIENLNCETGLKFRFENIPRKRWS